MLCSGLRSASPWFNYRPADGPFFVRFSMIFFCIPHRILWGNKSRMMRLVGHVLHIGRIEMRTTEDKKLVGRPWRRRENTIKMYLKDVGSQVMKLIRLV